MDWVRQLLAAAAVIGLLVASLAWLRRRGLARGAHAPANRRLEVLERAALTPQHSLHLIRMDDHVILVGRSPTGLVRLAGSSQELGQEGGR